MIELIECPYCSFHMKILLFFLVLIFAGCETLKPENPHTEPVNHSSFDGFLKKYIDGKGYVSYREALKDSSSLRNYIRFLEENPPNEIKWSEEERLAYWINLYNSATVLLVLRNYPLESIKDIGASLQIPFVNTPWQIEFLNIEGKAYDLDNIEHDIIRKQFDEPRIHFALVCGAVSCPKLRNEAYVAKKLDSQLDEQAREFLRDSSKNTISRDKVALSKLFRWYQGDFTKQGSLTDYLNNYSEVQIDPDTEINYLDYNWRLNDIKFE